MSDETILLVEDEAILAMRQQRAFSNGGYEVLLAHAPDKAIEMFEMRPDIDLVLMDINLDHAVSGADLAHRLLAVRRVPIVFVTSYAYAEAVRRTADVECYGYITKDMSEVAMHGVVAMALRHFRAVVALSQSSTRTATDELSLAVDTAGLGIWRLDVATGELTWNDQHLRIYGIDRSDFDGSLDSWRRPILPEDLEETEQKLRAMLDGNEVRDVVFRIRRTDGEIRYLSASARPIVRDGEVRELIGINTDITEQALREQELERLLSERELLFRETHHRVKNNLMTVSSLLQFAELSRGIDLSSVRSRIQAITRIHEVLHSGDMGSGVPMVDYLNGVLETAVGPERLSNTDVQFAVDDVTLDPDVALPIGLLANELLANAVRHGLRPDAPDARLRLAFTANEPSGYSLEVENTGQPFPDSVDIRNPRSLGLQLVVSLADQVHGTLDLDRGSATRFRVRMTGA